MVKTVDLKAEGEQEEQERSAANSTLQSGSSAASQTADRGALT